jgi:hypothetical protein
MTLTQYASLFFSGDNSTPDSANPHGSETSVEDFETWSSGKCLFICSVCLFESRNSSEFWRHASSEHNLGMSEYKDQFSDPCVERVKLECKICFKILRHDPANLGVHFSSIHGLEVKDYYEQHVRVKKKNPVGKEFCKELG